MSREEALETLLKSLFSHAELRRFLSRGPEGRQVTNALPEAAPLATYAAEATDELARRGLIDEALFSRLTEARPGRGNDIRAVAE